MRCGYQTSVIMAAQGVSKKWIFTLNNYTVSEEKKIEGLECAHIVVGKEIGESGTPHLQGYINYRQAHRFTAVKRDIGIRAHIEICRATDAAINYCKKDGDFFEKDNRRQGARSDLLVINALAQEGKYRDIQDKYPGLFWRYRQNIYRAHEVRNTLNLVRNWKPEVHVRWGEPGSGKTRFFYENYPGLHPMYKVNGFWSGYNGEETVLFDDFDGSWCKRAEFLQITDRYPFKIRVLGAFTNWTPKTILITSNTCPKEWYNFEPTAVIRRMSSILHLNTMAIVDST